MSTPQSPCVATCSSDKRRSVYRRAACSSSNFARSRHTPKSVEPSEPFANAVPTRDTAVTALLDRLLHGAHVRAADLAHQRPHQRALRGGAEVELTSLGPPTVPVLNRRHIAGFQPSTEPQVRRSPPSNRQDFVGLDPILDSNGGGTRRMTGASEGVFDATLDSDLADGLHGKAGVPAGRLARSTVPVSERPTLPMAAHCRFRQHGRVDRVARRRSPLDRPNDRSLRGHRKDR